MTDLWTPEQHDQHCPARQGGECRHEDGCKPSSAARGYVGPVAREITFDAQREPMFQDEQGNGWVPLATYNERCDEVADLKKRLGYPTKEATMDARSRLYGQIEDALAAGLTLDDVLAVAREAHSSLLADRSTAKDEQARDLYPHLTEGDDADS